MPCLHHTPFVPFLSQLNPVHGPDPLSWRSILILSSHLRVGLPSDLLSLRFPHQNPVCISHLPHACYMPHPPYYSWPDHPNIMYWALQIMKLLFNRRQFSPLPCYLLSLLSSIFSSTLSLYFSLNHYAPCILYIGQTCRYSPQYSFYIFSQQIYLIIFLDFLSPSSFIPAQNAVYFLMLPFLVHKIFTFYINGVLNCKCPAPGPKG